MQSTEKKRNDPASPVPHFAPVVRLKRAISIVLAAVALSACNGAITKFLDDREWTNRRKLTFNNSAQAENLVNFPVLVRLDSSRIDYTKTQDAGQDIRFYDSDNTTLLSHEIEKWDEAGSSYVWVKVPQIDAASASDHIYMYYGNAKAADAQSGTTVWESNFRGVWHLAGTSTATDSTANSFNGSTTGISAVTGMAGDAYAFNGTSGWVNLGNNRTILAGVSAVTLSGWYFFAGTVSSTQQLVAVSVNGGSPTSTSRATMTAVATNQVQAGGRAPDTTGTNQVQNSNPGGGVFSAGSWSYISVVIDYAAKDVTFYKNGAAVSDDGTTLVWTASAIDSTSSASAALGSEDDGSGTFFGGRMDEIRFANTGRSAAWIAADYKSTSDSFISFGSEELGR